MFDRPSVFGGEKRDGIEKLERFIETATAKYREENIPIGSDVRIDMEAYAGLYKNLPDDLAAAKKHEEEWHGNNPEEAKEKRLQSDGERLEMLALALFVKNLGERFVVARSSPHDDYVNKVDTILLDRKTGTLVCAFDEIGDTMNADYQHKLETVKQHNLKGGAALKYGLAVKAQEGEKRKIIPSSVEHIPLFYIALNQDRIEKGIREFMPDGQSEVEKKLFEYFTLAIQMQINNLESYDRRLHPELKEKLDAFKTVMSNLKEKS